MAEAQSAITRCASKLGYTQPASTMPTPAPVLDSGILEPGVRRYVEILRSHGVRTIESCEGGDGHFSSVPWIRFEGDFSEGLRAVSIALYHAMPVMRLRRSWNVHEDSIEGPDWEILFSRKAPCDGAKD